MLRVVFAGSDPPGFVGRLALQDRRIYFEYDPTWIQRGIELSPFKVPLQSGAVACPDAVFEGLFGVFNDSLPDGWGRLLLDRHVRSRGVAPDQLTPLDRLAHVGMRGMGALGYEPDIGETTDAGTHVRLDLLAAEVQQVLHGESTEVLPALLALAGSSAGARPKVMVGVSSDKRRIIYGQPLPSNVSPWLIKFASSADAPDCGALEYAYSLMARSAGIEMMPTHLFPAARGPGYFGVQRFDRADGVRIHLHTVSGLLHADHRFPSLDYEQVLQVALALTRDVRELQQMFRLAAFNVLAHNRDDHAKNIAFVMDAAGTWRCAPAYDLTFSRGPGGEQSTTVLGEGKAAGSEHLRALAKRVGLPDRITRRLLDEVRTAISAWTQHAKRAGVRKSALQAVWRVIAL